MHKDKLQKERMKEFRQKCVSWQSETPVLYCKCAQTEGAQQR